MGNKGWQDTVCLTSYEFGTNKETFSFEGQFLLQNCLTLDLESLDSEEMVS